MTFPRIHEGGPAYTVDGPAIPGPTVPVVLWAANTAYPAGYQVVAPTGQIVQAPAGGVPARASYQAGDGWVVLNDVGVGGGGGGAAIDDAGAPAAGTVRSSQYVAAQLATKVSTKVASITPATASAAPTMGVLNLYDATLGNLTPPLPPASSVPAGTAVGFKKSDPSPVNTVSPTCASGDHIGSASGATSIPIRTGEQITWLSSDGVSVWTKVDGELSLPAMDQRHGGVKYDPRQFGAKVDGVKLTDVTVPGGSGTAVIQSASYQFTAADVGKLIGVELPLGGAPDAWISTIASVSAGQATLASNAPATISAGSLECVFGTNDDAAWAACQAAASSAAAFGAVITIPRGRSVVSASLNLASTVTWVGESRETSIVAVVKNAGSSTVISDTSWLYSTSGTYPTPSATGVEFRDFKIEGRFLTGSAYTAGLKPLNVFSVRRIKVTGMWMDRTPATSIPCDHGFDQVAVLHNLVTGPGRMNDGTQPGGSGVGVGTAGTGASASEPGAICGNVIIGDGTHGVNGIFLEQTIQPGGTANAYTGGSLGYRIVGNFVSGMKFGITDSGSYGTLIENNTVVRCTTAGIAVSYGTFSKGMPGRHFTIQGNYVGFCAGASGTSNDRGHGILVDLTSYYDTTATILSTATGEGVIRANTISKNSGSGINILISTTDAQHLEVRDNYVTLNGLSGIWARYISGAASGSTKALRNCQIVDNTCFNNAGSAGVNGTSVNHCGIRIDTNVVNSDITDNACSDDQGTPTQVYGFFLSTGATFTGGSFKRNKLRNNKTGAVNIVTAPGWVAPALVADNDGYTLGGPTAVTATASPMTYTAGVGPEDVYITGGTVSSVTKGGQTVAAATNARVSLAPGEAAVITYSAAPTIVADKR